jgi:hypothetical protein
MTTVSMILLQSRDLQDLLDPATLFVLGLVVLFVGMIWWGNRRQTMKRYVSAEDATARTDSPSEG